MIRLHADDGVEVEGDLLLNDDAWAGAVVCHPHPAYGGDRHNVVVDRIFRTLAEAGVTVLRFDFRDTGADEQRDVLAAVGEIASHLEEQQPLWLAATWSDATVTVVEGADHFLAGAANRVAEAVLAWLRDRTNPLSGAPLD